MGYPLAGDRVDLLNDTGAPLRHDDVLVVLNAAVEPVSVRLSGRRGAVYAVLLDTTAEDGRRHEGDKHDVLGDTTRLRTAL